MHRNSQKRYYGEYIYSITCNTKNRIPFFRNKIFCEIWLEVLKKTKELKKFNLYAFCLNYDHFHILVGPNEEVANISQIMQALKKNVSQDINKMILGDNECLQNDHKVVSANANSRLQGEREQNILQDANKLNFWNDKHLQNNLMVVSSNSYSSCLDGQRDTNSRLHTKATDYATNKGMNGNTNNYGKFQRQKSFHDHIIRNEMDFIEHFKYIEYNYLKHDLPYNWKYTSKKNKDIIDLLEF